MFCKNCGTELEEIDKFCGKCGFEINGNKKRKNKSLIIIFSIIIFFILATLLGFYFYGNDIEIGDTTIKNPVVNLEITDEYLTNNLKENGFDQFDDIDVRIMAITDIEYNNFNKCVLAKIVCSDSGVEVTNPGLLLINRKDDIVEGFTINNNLIMILNGLINDLENNEQGVLEICVKYIKDYGIECFTNNNNEFKLLIKDISNIVGITQAREYVKSNMAQSAQLINPNLEYTVLFEKESAYAKYIAFGQETQEFNSEWPVGENTYKSFSNNYSYQQTFAAYAVIYGSPYIKVKQYEVYPFDGDTNDVKIYKTLEMAKQELNVEE